MITCFPPEPPKPKKECKNSGKYDESACSGWIKSCAKSSLFYEFMKDHCSETCGFCNKKGKAICLLYLIFRCGTSLRYYEIDAGKYVDPFLAIGSYAKELRKISLSSFLSHIC